MKSFALVTLVAWLATITAQAGTHTWTGAGFFGETDLLWSNPANWTPVGAPTVGETNCILIFPNSDAPKVTTNDIVGLNVAGIQFLGTNYVVHASPAGNSLGLLGQGNTGWNVVVQLGNDTPANVTCRFASDCPIALRSYGTFSVNGGAEFQIYSRISGAGGFTLAGGGALSFRSAIANTYTGVTTVQDGFLHLATGPVGTGATAIPGPLVIGGTNSDYSPWVTLLNNNQIAANVSVTVNQTGWLTLNGMTNTVGSLTIVDGAGVWVGAQGSEEPPGLLKLNGNISTLPYVGNAWNGRRAEIYGCVDLGPSTRTFNVADGSFFAIYGVISGGAGAGITKTGAGEFLATASTNTYTGTTTVQGGTYDVWDNHSLGSTNAGTVVTAGATLSLMGIQVNQETLTLIGGAEPARLECSFGQSNHWSGPISVTGDGEIWVSDGSSGNGQLVLSGAISGSGSIHKTGPATLEFSGFSGNTFSGGLFAEQGNTHLNKSASAPAFSGPLIVGRETDLYPGDQGIVSVKQINQIPNDSQITILSTGYLTGIASDTIGNVDFHGGTMNALGFTLAGNVTNYSTVPFGGPGFPVLAGTLTLSAGTHFIHGNLASSVLSVVADLQGTGAVTKTGPGRLKFSSASSYSGLTWVKEGELWLAGNGCPGSSAVGTIVEPGAALHLDTCSVTNEALILYGQPGAITLSSYGTNRWKASVTLHNEVRIWTGTIFTLDGIIAGDGGIFFDPQSGKGTLEFAGSSDNNYAGDTTIKSGKLLLNKSAAKAVPGNLFLNGNLKLYGTNVPAFVRLLQPNQIADASAVTVTAPNWLDLNGHAETIGSLSGSGNVNLLSATLTAGGNGETTTFSGPIYGTGGLTKTGAGTFTLTADNSYTGTTTVNAGTLLVNGQQPFSAVSLLSGGMLGGNGTVGNLYPLTGHVAPGTSPGILTCSNFSTLNPANQLQVEINGPSPGSGYDQLQVKGTVQLTGATLQLAMNIGGAISNQYVIISNDGVDAVGGIGFGGLPEGAMFTNNGAAFVITYHGGDGNDVALIQQSIGYVSKIISGAKQPNGRFAITATGAPNTTYRVDACTNLIAPVAWTQIGTVVASGSGIIAFSDAGAPQFPMRFYRLRYP